MSDHAKKQTSQTVIHIPIRLVLEIEIVTTEPIVMEATPTPTAALPDDFNGAELRKRREVAGLTRAALGARAGLAPATIRNIETRKHRTTPEIIRRLCAVAELNFKTPRGPKRGDD